MWELWVKNYTEFNGGSKMVVYKEAKTLGELKTDYDSMLECGYNVEMRYNVNGGK